MLPLNIKPPPRSSVSPMLNTVLPFESSTVSEFTAELPVVVYEVWLVPICTLPVIVASAIAPVTAAIAAIATRVFFISNFSKG